MHRSITAPSAGRCAPAHRIKLTYFDVINDFPTKFSLFPCKRPKDIRYFKYRKIREKCGTAAPLLGRYPPMSNQQQFLSRCI